SSSLDTSSNSTNNTIVPWAVGVGILTLLSLILCTIMHCRRSLQTRTQISPAQGSDSSKEIRSHINTAHDVHRVSWASYIDRVRQLTRSETISTRQLVISNQVNRARKRVAELEEISTVLRALSTSASREHRTRPTSETDQDVPPPPAEDGSVSPSEPESLGVQIEHAIRQIEGLNNRIHELERQRRSSWALGMSDEPPPGYTEDSE
ncbi:hypothetical protein B0H13DRAFT_340729, partial [Mycena leptocephala]